MKLTTFLFFATYSSISSHLSSTSLYMSRYKYKDVCVMVLVQPLLSLLHWLQVCLGNVQVWGFILSEHGLGPLRNMTGQLWPRLCLALP